MTLRLTFEDKNLQCAAGIIKKGGLVAFPTETIYGLGCDAANSDAVRRLYEVKGRPCDNPLIIHIHHRDEAARYAHISAKMKHMMNVFWGKDGGGALTFIAPLSSHAPVCAGALAGRKTIALRLPLHEGARRFIKLAQCALAAPSANISGRLSPSSHHAVLAQLDGHIDAIMMENTSTLYGIESTILDMTQDPPLRLRMGALDDEILRHHLGEMECYEDKAQENINLSSGLFGAHYAPLCALRLEARTCHKNEAGLSFGDNIVQGAHPHMNLSKTGDVREAGRNLYEMLRLLDAQKPAAIAVAPIPHQGMGQVINERLHRAAMTKTMAKKMAKTMAKSNA